VACHTTGGAAGVGPTWKGLAGSQHQLADGSTVTADDAYLRESILQPNAKIAKGCLTGNCTPNIMPSTFGDKLTAEQVDQIIEYIKTIR
jgi:cytochrome c oxidase subunit 2